ncbi:MAG TPA: MBL fold metallo-hydrolase [Bacillaceae bacterium]|nr:MBL fold metallo-hydrolase [Paenibacillus bovis]HLU22186.1 MBL fold metallo-hydrolase [Bacillaceae bacterium]
MKWVQIPLGPLQTNCYILYNEDNDCIVFDPGAQGKELVEYVEEQQFSPKAILMTHAHFDHIGAIDAIRDRWRIPVYIHELEEDWLTNPSLNRSSFFGAEITVNPADKIISQEGKLNIGDFSFSTYHTPGHSPGSISYYCKEANIVIAGDTLFHHSIGRTDLPGGNHVQLITSIESKLFTLPDDTIVLPGHGTATTIKQEKESNPFL